MGKKRDAAITCDRCGANNERLWMTSDLYWICQSCWERRWSEQEQRTDATTEDGEDCDD